MCASCGAFLRRVVWFCALCAVRATAGSMPKSSGSMPTSVGSMPKSVKAVMKAAQARVNEAHDQIKHQTDLWNCKEDLEHFSSKWSPEKQKYCCDLGMGCRGQSGSAADGGGDAVAQGLETHEGAGDAAAHGLGTHGGDAAAHGLDTHGGDAVAHGLDTHGGPGSSEGAKESTPDSTKEDNSRTLAVEVGKPFAEKVEHESMIGTTYEAMAGSGEVWPSWLQFDPVQGRLYGIPAAVSKPMSIEVAKTIFAGGEFNHDTFRYKLVVVPAGAESTTLRTSTVASTTDAVTGAAPSMLGISSPAATPGAAAGGTAQGDSQASGHQSTGEAATTPGISSSSSAPTHSAAAGETAQGTSPASGDASTGAAATMPGISSSAATPGAAAGGTAQGSSPASGDASTGEATSSAAATPGAGAGGTAQGTSQDSGDALTGAAATMPGISSSAATGAAAGGTSQRSSPASGDASTGAEASMPGISSSAATPGAAAGGTAQGTSQASGDALTAAAATMPGIRSSAGTPGAAAGGTAQGTSPAFGDVSTGAATTVLDISSSAATPGSAAGGTAQGSSPASGDALTGAAATMLGISSSAATAVAAAGGTAQATSEASGASGSTNGAGSSIAAASNLGVQAAAQSTTGAPAGPTTSMVKLVPSDKEKAIAEELIQHEVPDKAASLGSVGNLPGPNFGGCIIQDAMCEPLDMNWSLEELGREAEDAEDCQQQCRDKVNCACFTYYAQLKACHFASAMSNVRKNAPGFVGGKAYCDEALQGLRAHTVTQIIRKRKCMSDVSFLQPMCTIAAPTTFLDDPVDCQHRCQDHDWCSSFAYNTLTKSCDLQCANATPIHAPVYAMSGPKICSLSLVLGMTLTCPWNFDYEAEKWAQVLVSGLVHAVAKIRTLGGSRANALTAQDVGVSMDKPEDSADNSRSYQLRFDVNEHLAMYLYSLLKSKSTGSKFNEYTENFTSNAAETVLKSQCRPKVSFDFVKKHVEGASFQKLAPLGQSLHLMNHSVQQYSARKAEPAEGAKFDWLLMTVGSFMAVLAIWMLPRWWVQFSKGQCVPSCDPCPEVDVRQAQVGVPLVDEVGVPLVDDEDREPSEEELRPQVMPIVQETDFLMV